MNQRFYPQRKINVHWFKISFLWSYNSMPFDLKGQVQEALPTGGLKPAVTILSEHYWQTVHPISLQWALCQMDIWNKSKLSKKSSLWLASKDSFTLTDTSTTPLGCQGQLSVILWAPYFRGNGNNPILVLMNDDWGNSTGNRSFWRNHKMQM